MTGELGFIEYLYKPSQAMRVLIDEANQSWFLARDVCEVLGLADVSMSMQRLDEDEKLIQTIHVSGQNRNAWFINESGLYNLVFTSNKPEAKAFRKWVTSCLLPVIRKRLEMGKIDKLPLEAHTKRETQVTMAKEANGYAYRKNGVKGCIEHNQSIVKAVSGKYPHELKEEAKAKGLPSKQRKSGKEVLRHTAPAQACAVSLGDRLVSKGYNPNGSLRAATASLEVFRIIEELSVELLEEHY